MQVSRSNVPLAVDHAHPIWLDGNPLAGAIARRAFAARFIQMAEQPGPRPGHTRLAGQFAEGAFHHGVHAFLFHPVAFPPVAVPGAFPISHLGIMNPGDASRVDALGHTHRLERLRLRPRGRRPGINRAASGKDQRLSQEGATAQRARVGRKRVGIHLRENCHFRFHAAI